MSAAVKRPIYICLAVLISLWFANNSQKYITDEAIIFDASQNLRDRL